MQKSESSCICVVHCADHYAVWGHTSPRALERIVDRKNHRYLPAIRWKTPGRFCGGKRTSRLAIALPTGHIVQICDADETQILQRHMALPNTRSERTDKIHFRI